MGTPRNRRINDNYMQNQSQKPLAQSWLSNTRFYIFNS